jgi:SNF2 family DNA or RNA helicase
MWQHQLEAYHEAFRKRGYFLGLGMGTGKTKIAIDLIQNWRETCEESRRPVLIVCPKAVIETWPWEIEKHMVDDAIIIRLNRGTTETKAHAADMAWKNHAKGDRPLVYVVNYETVWREPLGRWIRSKQWAAIVCDESHRIKAPAGKASRFLARCRAKAHRRLCLTGTPMPHSPMDIYAQFRFLEPSVFGQSAAAFRARYATMDPRFANQVQAWRCLDDMNAAMAPYMCEHRSDDVLDLPPKIHQVIPCDLSARARRIYASIASSSIAEIEQGQITASNALVRLLRLRQIASGVIVTDDNSMQKQYRVDRSKIDALAELVEDIGPEHTVVFCEFHHDLDAVIEVAKKLGIRYGEISGRANDLDGSQLPSIIGRPMLFGVQMRSGSAGIDLSRSAYAIYFSTGFSLGDYRQSLARLHRPMQTRTVRYYHLVARNTVDEYVYTSLERRAAIVESALRPGEESDFAQEIIEQLKEGR